MGDLRHQGQGIRRRAGYPSATINAGSAATSCCAYPEAQYGKGGYECDNCGSPMSHAQVQSYLKGELSK